MTDQTTAPTGVVSSTELGKWLAMTAVEKLRQQVEIRGTRSPFGMVAVEALEEIERLRAALQELVSLEDMRNRLRQLHHMGHGTDYENYYRRLPLAWDEARKALQPNK